MAGGVDVAKVIGAGGRGGLWRQGDVIQLNDLAGGDGEAIVEFGDVMTHPGTMEVFGVERKLVGEGLAGANDLAVVFEEAAGGFEREDMGEALSEDLVAGLEQELFGVVIEIGEDEVFDGAGGIGSGADGFEDEEGVEGAVGGGKEADLTATVGLGGAVEVAIGDEEADQRESEQEQTEPEEDREVGAVEEQKRRGGGEMRKDAEMRSPPAATSCGEQGRRRSKVKQTNKRLHWVVNHLELLYGEG